MRKEILIKRLILLLLVAGLSVACYYIMNQRYDRLSRYPYQDKDDRALIDQYLNDEQIEYIIEYSIAPKSFVQYLGCNGFNIYHISEYNMLSDYLGYGSACDFVSKIELTRDKIGVVELAELSKHYKSDVIDFWFMYGDIYNANSQLAFDPSYLDAIVDDNVTVSKYQPADLVSLDESIPSDEKIQVSARILIPLSNLCDALSENFGGKCGGVVIDTGYISYTNQVELYTAMQTTYGTDTVLYCDYPGHSEHQLGLAVDLELENDQPIAGSEQYDWLVKHSSEYGFIQTYGVNNPYNKPVREQHFRFNGVFTQPVIDEVEE